MSRYPSREERNISRPAAILLATIIVLSSGVAEWAANWIQPITWLMAILP